MMQRFPFDMRNCTIHLHGPHAFCGNKSPLSGFCLDQRHTPSEIYGLIIPPSPQIYVNVHGKEFRMSGSARPALSRSDCIAWGDRVRIHLLMKTI